MFGGSSSLHIASIFPRYATTIAVNKVLFFQAICLARKIIAQRVFSVCWFVLHYFLQIFLPTLVCGVDLVSLLPSPWPVELLNIDLTSDNRSRLHHISISAIRRCRPASADHIVASLGVHPSTGPLRESDLGIHAILI